VDRENSPSTSVLPVAAGNWTAARPTQPRRHCPGCWQQDNGLPPGRSPRLIEVKAELNRRAECPMFRFCLASRGLAYMDRVSAKKPCLPLSCRKYPGVDGQPCVPVATKGRVSQGPLGLRNGEVTWFGAATDSRVRGNPTGRKPGRPSSRTWVWKRFAGRVPTISKAPGDTAFKPVLIGRSGIGRRSTPATGPGWRGWSVVRAATCFAIIPRTPQAGPCGTAENSARFKRTVVGCHAGLLSYC